MVLRDEVGSLEVLMLRRSLRSEFVAGAYVFPGGAVEDEDLTPAMLARCTGRDDDQASRVLDLDESGLGYWVCAFRECFEEAGVLVADGPDGRPLDFEDPAVEARFAEHRQALNAGERSFLDICRAEDLSLPADALYYVSHWITPEGPPRRYDTRFFAARAPVGQTAFHDRIETIDHMWVSPAEALARGEAGEIGLILPTVSNLRLLAGFRSTTELAESVSALGAIPTIEPEVVLDERGNRRVAAGAEPADPSAGEG
jgi:8-oxo-dGTP pyrophosphatase MutT (NUDIX family)